jgi:hypothetical protein
VTIAPLVCEDLARLEPVASVVRTIGPSLVVTLLLDGPQLSSRWTARYASVLADDPGSSVCTLSSYGLVRRCCPAGCAQSSVVALWKDASGQLIEIALEDGADAVLVATHVTIGDSSTADGRRHPGTISTLRLAAVQSIRALRPIPTGGARPRYARSTDEDRRPALDDREISKATSWAEALAEAAVSDPASIDRLLSQAKSRDWRTPLGLPAPSPLFTGAIDALRRGLPQPPTLVGLYAAAARLRRSSKAAAVVTGRLLEIALDQRIFAEVQAGRLAPDVLRSLQEPPG